MALGIVDVLQSMWKLDTCAIQEDERITISCNLCVSLRQVAANDDICREITDKGILELLPVILEFGIQEQVSGSPDLIRSCLGLYRQIIASDYVKHNLDDDTFIEHLKSILQHGIDCQCSDVLVLEQALGVLTAYCLRNPDISTKVVEQGCADLIIDTMNSILDTSMQDQGKAKGPAARALRQGCMSLRNIASRSPEIRQNLLDKDVLKTIESSKAAHEALCGDVGSAAIRDITS